MMSHFFKLDFTPCTAKQTVRGMKLQENENDLSREGERGTSSCSADEHLSK